MRAAVRAEWRKLRTTRLWWILLLAMAAYLALIGGVLAGSFALAPATGPGAAPVHGVDAALGVYGLVNAVGYVFPLVIGSLMVTTEFRYQTITESLLVEPRRTVLLVAKLAVAAPVGLLYGIAGTAGLLAVAAPLLAWQGDGAHLGDRAVVTAILLGVLVTALWAVIGAAFGAVVPNQVAAVVVLLAFTQFVEPVARLALAAVDGASQVAKFLPGAAADGVIGSSLVSQLGGGGSDLLPRGAALAVLIGYAVVLAALGRATTLRRDIG